MKTRWAAPCVKAPCCREEIFITSKIWNTDQGYDSTLRAFDASMQLLQMDYLDLYLIHWPVPAGHADDYRQLNRETWKAMEQLYRDGRSKPSASATSSPTIWKP